MRDVIAPDLGSQISPNPSSDCSVKASFSFWGKTVNLSTHPMAMRYGAPPVVRYFDAPA